MLPQPPYLGTVVEKRSPQQLFYVIKHGIKFTGMPAWPAQSRDDEVWSVVAFLLELPKLDGSAGNPIEAARIAGVMGGADTEVKETTKKVFLESAYFFPFSVRRTSKALGLKTESAYRFERGTDIELLGEALDRAAFLMSEIAGGKVMNLSVVGGGVTVNRLLLEDILTRHEANTILYVVDSFDFYSREWNEDRLQDSRLFLRAPLDPALAEAHASLGWVRCLYDWDPPGARAAFERALTLDPGYAVAYHFYGFCLGSTGRTDEGRGILARAERLDPAAHVEGMRALEQVGHARVLPKAWATRGGSRTGTTWTLSSMGWRNRARLD